MKRYTVEQLDSMSDQAIMAADFVLEVHNPNDLPLYDFREFKPLQEIEGVGMLKELMSNNAARLKRTLMKRGFTRPMSVVHIHQGGSFEIPAEGGVRQIVLEAGTYLDDGHGRRRLFTTMQPHSPAGEPIYHFPCLEVTAADPRDAYMQLLENNSNYHTTTQEGLWTTMSVFGLTDDWSEKYFNMQGIWSKKPSDAPDFNDFFKKHDDINEKHKTSLVVKFDTVEQLNAATSFLQGIDEDLAAAILSLANYTD